MEKKIFTWKGEELFTWREKKIFTRKDLAQVDTLVSLYMGVELVVNIGKYSKGTCFSSVLLDYGEDELTLYEGEKAVEKLKLEVTQ